VPTASASGQIRCLHMLLFCAGHTSWSTSGLGYVSFWLLGKLRLYDGSSHIWKWPVALAPLGGAIWIGITRLQVGAAAHALESLAHSVLLASGVSIWNS
jgi:hypothetical protein